MRIAVFEEADRAALKALWARAGLLVNELNDPDQDIDFARKSGHGEILVGYLDEQLVASVMVGHDGHRGWIYYMAVEPGRQGGGLGREILRAGEAWLAERGAPKSMLMVRDTNTAVVGYYQRCGYVHEPRVVMSRRLDGRAVARGGTRSDQPVVITYLEMTERPDLKPREPGVRPVALLRAEAPTVSFYRYLYDAVGRDWIWTDRKALTDAELAAIIGDERVEIFVLHVRGTPAGYFELDRREEGRVDLAYFGIMPEFIGMKLGPWLLGEAIETAWRHAPERLTVNTCTLDHPAALPLYQRMGFRPIGRRIVGEDDGPDTN